jgi:hypothetical protein
MLLLLLMYCYYYSLSFILTDFIKSETWVCHFDHVNKVIIFDGRASKQRFNCWRRAFLTINTCDT